MQMRWAAQLARDPAQNPSLVNTGEDFSLAQPPRVSLMRPRFDTPAEE